jgi:hypothetical protein
MATTPTPSPTVANTVQDVLNHAANTLKKSGGWRNLLGHGVAEIVEIGIGAAASYGGARAARQLEMKAAQAHAEALRGEGKHEEAHSFMNSFLAAWTSADEAAEFKVIPRTVKHFNRNGESGKADRLLATFCGLDPAGLNRLGEILLDCGDEDSQYRYLVNWGDASVKQQKRMLLIARLEVPLNHQPGHVFATEMRRVAIGQRDKSRANVGAIKKRIRRVRRQRAQRAARP